MKELKSGPGISPGLGPLFSSRLVQALSSPSLRASLVKEEEPIPRDTAILVEGEILSVREGNAIARVVTLGLAGQATVAVLVKATDPETGAVIREYRGERSGRGWRSDASLVSAIAEELAIFAGSELGVSIRAVAVGTIPSVPAKPSVVSVPTPAALPRPVEVRAQGPAWKEIEVGTTTRSEIESRFEKAKQGKEGAYVVSGIDARIAFDGNDRVRSIRVDPPVAMDEDAVRAAFGEPDRERRSDDFIKIWEFDERGMTIEFAEDNESVAIVEYRMPTGEPGTKRSQATRATFAAPQPLLDLPARRKRVEAALAASSGGFSLVGMDAEYRQAQAAYAQVHQSLPVVQNLEVQRYVNGVMDRLVSVTPSTPFPWPVRLIDVPVLNAMNAGGGYIFLYTGLFKHLDSEAQLAYVLAHEMGHQLKRHVAAGQTRAEITKLFLTIAGIATAGATQNADAGRAVMNLGSVGAGAVLAKFSRDHEVEADEIGLILLAEAGYDAREAEKVAQKFVELKAIHGTQAPLFATHPAPEIRRDNVRQWLITLPPPAGTPIFSTPEFDEFKQAYRY